MSLPLEFPRERDAAARLAAQEVFDRPIALEAGAGTGKTATLVARVVAWCVGKGWELEAANGDGAEEIAGRVLDGVVAVTFTDDAAAEMAERVARAFFVLERWDGSTETSAEFSEYEEVEVESGNERFHGLFRHALPDDVATVNERARTLLVQIERLRASTIHAFAGSILARFPVDAGLHPAFTVDADGSLVQQMVETAAEEVLLTAYGRHEEDALAPAEKGIGPSDITAMALDLATAGVPLEALERDPFDEERATVLVDDLAKVLSGCQEDLVRLTQVSGADAVRRAAEFLLGLQRIADQPTRSAATRLEDLAAKVCAEHAANKNKLDAWARNANGFRRTATKVLQDPKGLHSAASRLKLLLEATGKLDPTTFNQLRRVLGKILARVEAEKRRRGVVVFQDLLVKARALLAANETVRRTLQSEIRQLLVDEMQDTDPEQAEIVRLLALDPDVPPDQRPCLFLVGDPKQSIYGWRSADLAVYEDLVQEIEKMGGDRHDLVVSFRSVPPILREVQRIVAPNMRAKKGLQPPFVPLEACRKLESAEGHRDDHPRRRPVEHWAIVRPADDEEPHGPATKTSATEAARIEAEAVARDIAALREQGEDLSGMCVLMRSRSKLQILLNELRLRGIPYEVGKDRSYFRTREVQEAMALVRLILDRHDPLALASVLRSPQVGVPDAALAPLWRAGLPRLVARLPEKNDTTPSGATDVVGRAVGAVAELDLGHVDGLDRLSSWPEALLAFLEILGRLRLSWLHDPPDRFLEELRQRTLLEPLAAGRFPGAYRLANVDRFLRSLEEHLLQGATADVLLRWLRRLGREQPDEPTARPRGDVGEAVRVLTIHGAKGLEFDHVWLVQTHAPEGSGRGRVAEAGRVDGRWELQLNGLPTPGYYRLKERRKDVEEAEQVRLLYVALTRAKKRLVASACPNPHGGLGPLLQHLKQRTCPDDGAKGCWVELPVLWNNAGRDGRLERDGALWSLPGLSAWRASLGDPKPAGAVSELPSRERIASDEARLRSLRMAASARQARPWLAGISAEAHCRLAEIVAATVEGAETAEEEAAFPRTKVGRDVATAVGTAVHRVLERFDLEAVDPGAELDGRKQGAAAWLEAAVPAERISEAREHLHRLLEVFRSGPLWERWLGLRGHVLARELPVLLPPGDGPEVPVGALTGAIDLLYRDPQTGELVVADYKTDSPERLNERSDAYAAQLAPYAEAIRAALHLPSPPRSELWFVAAGKIVRVS